MKRTFTNLQQRIDAIQIIMDDLVTASRDTLQDQIAQLIVHAPASYLIGYLEAMERINLNHRQAALANFADRLAFEFSKWSTDPGIATLFESEYLCAKNDWRRLEAQWRSLA